MAETMIPILPCHSMGEQLDFYRALGFEVTHHQKSPNPYAAVALPGTGFQLQFFGLKGYDPASSYSTCYVLTDDVDARYESFRGGLKAALGRVPVSGLPRLGRLKDTTYGVRQFLLTDPGGNCIRIGQPISDNFDHSPIPKERFARALHQATLLGESKGDHAAAARILDRALTGGKGEPTPEQLVQLLLLRAEMAVQLGDGSQATGLLDQVARHDLSGAALERVTDLREQLARCAAPGAGGVSGAPRREQTT